MGGDPYNTQIDYLYLGFWEGLTITVGPSLFQQDRYIIFLTDGKVHNTRQRIPDY